MAAERKHSKYMVNGDNGFHVIVNHFIMRYIYSHMKERSDDFSFISKLDSEEEKKYLDFTVVVNTSRQRMSRLLEGNDFEMPPNRVRDLVQQFGLSEDYFNAVGSTVKEGRYIEIDSLTPDDWKVYLSKRNKKLAERYEKKYIDESGTIKEKVRGRKDIFPFMESPQQKEERVRKVEQRLKELFVNGKLNRKYDEKTDVFKVYYYFRFNRAYKREMTAEVFKKIISSMEFSVWDKIENQPEEMKWHIDMLEAHLDYLKTIKRYHEIKEIANKGKNNK